MRTPELKHDGDALVWTFGDIGIAIGFDLLHETSDGLLGEISVQGAENIQPGRPPHYHWAKINLSSTRSRSDLVRTLNGRNPDLDWTALLEYACVHTAETWRHGEPVIDLSVGPEPEDDLYLVDKLLPDGESSVIFADGGSGKSLIAAAVGFSVRSGLSMPGGLKPTRQGNVLYLDWETNRSTVKRRIHWLARGHGITPPTILYRPMYRALADDLATIRQEVTRHAVQLVIVDSIGPACGGEPEKAEVILRIFNAMRALAPATRLVVSHISRAGAEQKNGAARPFGSAFVLNMARSVWELRTAEHDETSTTISTALYARKSNDDRLHAPIGLAINFDRARRSIQFASQDVSEDSGLAAHGSLTFRVRETLKKGVRDTKALANYLDVTELQVRRAMKRMGDVQQLSGGVGRGNVATWGLKASGSMEDDTLPF